MLRTKIALGFLVFLLAGALVAVEEKDNILRLKIGDPQLKDKTMAINPGQIYSAEKGSAISFEKMIAEMKTARIVYVGESHNSLPMHDVQHKIAQALYALDKDLAIGLEMYDIRWQEPLNKWSLGLLTEDEFIDQAQWYVNWNFNFKYYKKIFDLAKEYKIPIHALNAPRNIIRKIRMRGWDALSNKEKQIVPKPDLTNKDHIALMRAIFGDIRMPAAMKGHGSGDMMFKALYRAQSSWDEVMAKNTLRTVDIEGKRVIVFVGSGHLIYNLGINRRAYERQSLPYKTVICVIVPEGKDSVVVSRSLGHYIWGLPEESRPEYPSIGIALKKFDGLDNLVIAREPMSGAAKGKNFKKGDIVIAVDGRHFTCINCLRKYLSEFTWGDEVAFKLLREAKELEIKIKF